MNGEDRGNKGENPSNQVDEYTRWMDWFFTDKRAIEILVLIVSVLGIAAVVWQIILTKETVSVMEKTIAADRAHIFLTGIGRDTSRAGYVWTPGFRFDIENRGVHPANDIRISMCISRCFRSINDTFELCGGKEWGGCRKDIQGLEFLKGGDTAQIIAVVPAIDTTTDRQVQYIMEKSRFPFNEFEVWGFIRYMTDGKCFRLSYTASYDGYRQEFEKFNSKNGVYSYRKTTEEECPDVLVR